METNRRTKRIPSGDKFSFPVMSDEFEFGSLTSPASPNSPADHLFSNGKLLPHAFPVQAANAYSYSRSTSKDYSMVSSRSNSTNSRTSTSTSARTSTSEASTERRSLRARDHHHYGGAAGRRESVVRSPVVMSCQYQYGASRRWQLIAAAPALKQQGPSVRARRASESAVDGRKGGKKAKPNWFKWFVSACQECHAIKT